MVLGVAPSLHLAVTDCVQNSPFTTRLQYLPSQIYKQSSRILPSTPDCSTCCADIKAVEGRLRDYLADPQHATLDLGACHLTEWPGLGSAFQLTTLNMSRNMLKSLPAEIGSLTSLVDLNLSYNWLATLPEYAPTALAHRT